MYSFRDPVLRERKQRLDSESTLGKVPGPTTTSWISLVDLAFLVLHKVPQASGGVDLSVYPSEWVTPKFHVRK